MAQLRRQLLQLHIKARTTITRGALKEVGLKLLTGGINLIGVQRTPQKELQQDLAITIGKIKNKRRNYGDQAVVLSKCKIDIYVNFDDTVIIEGSILNLNKT
jgi:hypothetical protein